MPFFTAGARVARGRGRPDRVSHAARQFGAERKEGEGRLNISRPYSEGVTVLDKFPAAARQTETGESGAEKREAGRFRSWGHRRDIDARRRLEREVRRASIGNSVGPENDGSAVVEHGGRVNVGEKVVGTAQIKISGARHLSAVPRRVG